MEGMKIYYNSKLTRKEAGQGNLVFIFVNFLFDSIKFISKKK